MRIALHFKLMATYLLVVGIVFGPVFLFLRRQVTAELRAGIELDLETEARLLAERLSAVAPKDIPSSAASYVVWFPHRSTVISPDGTVLADSEQGHTFDNHADRPEVRDAMAHGIGRDQRRSATTGRWMIYVAVRVPTQGPLSAIVRLSKPLESIEAVEARTVKITNRAAAVAISVGVVLSAVVSLVLARPLKRVADAAKTLAAGDFGQVIEEGAHDEVGDAARALKALSSQLRERLVHLGADRATLGTLIDEMHVGVVMFNAEGELDIANGPARKALGLSAESEEERLRALRETAPHDQLVRRALETGESGEAPVQLVQSESGLVAHWFCVFGVRGTRRLALLVLDRSETTALERTTVALRTMTERMRTILGTIEDLQHFKTIYATITSSEDAVTPTVPDAQDIAGITLGDLCALAMTLPQRRARMSNVTVRLELPDSDVEVVDAEGAVQRALERAMLLAIMTASAGTEIVVRSECEERDVLLYIPLSANNTHTVEQIAARLRPVRSDAMVEGSGDRLELRLRLARA